jgi:hypothetical protein
MFVLFAFSPCRNIWKSGSVNVRFWDLAGRIANFSKKFRRECLGWKLRRAERISDFHGKKTLVLESLGRL